MFERYTEDARRAILAAREEAAAAGSGLIESEHLLIGLLRTDAFLHSQQSLDTFRKSLDAHVDLKPPIAAVESIRLSNESERILSLAAEESKRLGHRDINCLHLALGVLAEQKSLAALLLGEQDSRVRDCWLNCAGALPGSFHPHLLRT